MINNGIHIANSIREQRIKAKLSQSAVAQALDTPLRTYQGWEKEFTSSIQNLLKICSFFDVPIETFVAPSYRTTDSQEDSAAHCNPLPGFKIKIFRMAMEGAENEEIFTWFSKIYPEKAAAITDRDQFIENCFLDIYHCKPELLQNYHFHREKEKEHAIAKRFSLPPEQIIVVHSGHIAHEVIREMIIAPFGAQWIVKSATEKPGLRIGISNGFTIARILDGVQRGCIENMVLFPLNFTSTQVDFPISSTALISSFLYRFAGYGVTTDTVNEEQVYSSMLLADAAFLGIGTFSTEGLYERMIRSVLGHSVVADMRTQGVIGDFNYHLFDASGNEVVFPEVVADVGNFDQKALVKSIGLEQLKQKADRGGRIVIAGTGEHKTDSIAVALKNGYANHLITDESIADQLLRT